MLALCYWNTASLKSHALDRARSGTVKVSDEDQEQFRRQQLDNLQKAAEQCDKVEGQLRARQQAGSRLWADEEAALKRAAFIGAECYFYMPKHDEAVRRYAVLALRYQRQPEELIARSQLFQCYQIYSNKPDLARDQLRLIREAVEKWPDAAFDGSMDTHKREKWADWLATAAKLVPQAPVPRCPNRYK